MTILKGLKGNPTVSVAGKSRQFVEYGAAQVLAAFEMNAGDTGVWTPDTGPADAIVIVQQPAIGRAVARSDGRISLDFNDGTTREETVVYKKSAGGTTTQQTLTVKLTPPKNTLGWDPGRAYNLEVDSNNAVVVEPPEVFRPIYIADGSGLGTDYAEFWDLAAIQAKEGHTNSLNQTGYDAARTPAKGETWYYGDDPSRPVEQGIGERIQRATGDAATQFEKRFRLFYKYGDTFTRPPTESIAATGESMLHPNLVSAWGNPADGLPVFENPFLLVMGSNLVVQNLKCRKSKELRNFDNVILDNIWMDGDALIAQPTNTEMCRCLTLRRIRSYDSKHPCHTRRG